MKSGDKNSSYFHNRASHRFIRNRILGLRDLRGVMCIGDDNVAELLENYYRQLFTSAIPCNMDEVTRHASVVVNKEMNI